MRREIIVMLTGLLYFAAGAVLAGQPVAPEPAVAAPNRGALFKVEQNGHTLYLFGTIHIGAPDFYPLEPRVMAALTKSSVLALEIDPQGDPQAMIKAVRQYGMVQDGVTAASQIAPDYRGRLARLLKQYGVVPEAAAGMKPWMLATVLAVGEYAAQGFQTSLAVDTYLSQQARLRQIPVLELETVAGQMALFDSLPMVDQVRFLEESIASIEGKEQALQAKQLVQAWRSANVALFETVARKAAEDTSFSGRFVHKTLLQERNPGLAEGIATLLARENSSLAAIGVLHLVGPGSVPALLAQRGLKVERVY